MREQTLSHSRPAPRPLAALGPLVAVGALALVAPLLAVVPAGAAPVRATTPAVPSEVAAAAQPTHDVSARAGRSGAKLRKIFVRVAVSSSGPGGPRKARAVIQRKRSGQWLTVGRIGVPVEGPPVSLVWRSRSAATLRVTVPALQLVSPTMRVPAAPKSTRSRYYVRTFRSGEAGEVLRVFKGGVAYGISYADLEFSCMAGRLSPPWLRLVSYDFAGWRVRYRTAGTWKRLTLQDETPPLGRPRTSLSGTSKRYFRFCAAPTFASVSTDPGAV